MPGTNVYKDERMDGWVDEGVGEGVDERLDEGHRNRRIASYPKYLLASVCTLQAFRRLLVDYRAWCKFFFSKYSKCSPTFRLFLNYESNKAYYRCIKIQGRDYSEAPPPKGAMHPIHF